MKQVESHPKSNLKPVDKKKVGKFVIDMSKVLGKGQYGTVYQAENKITQEKLAAKILSVKQISQDPYTIQALKRQIEIMQRIKSNNIIQFIENVHTTNNIYIFQQLANGGTLAQALKQTPYRRFEEKRAVRHIVEILNGFRELIKHGIIHRDIKIENILISNGECKIADFGLSRYNKISSISSFVGTPIYMAPQIMTCYLQQDHSGYSYKCDIWSLGVVCYELVTGCLPWKPYNYDIHQLTKMIKQKCDSGIQFPKNIKISDQYKNFVIGCLKYQQTDRFNWDQIFSHKLFQGLIIQPIASYDKFTVVQLRSKIHSNNLSLQKLTSKLPEQCSQENFYLLLRILDGKISEQQSHRLFKKIAKQQKKVSKHLILQWLESFGIRITGMTIKSKPQQKDKLTAMLKISQKIQQQNIDLFSLFKKFDPQKNNMLSKQQFGCLLKSLYQEVTEEQIQEIYKFNNPENNRGVKFCQFYENLCKIIQVPAVKNEILSKQVNKLLQRNN